MNNFAVSLERVVVVAGAGLAISQSGSTGKAQGRASGGEAHAGPRAPKPEAAQAMARAQELLFRKNDPEASIAEFKKVVKLDPWYGQGYILLGVAYMQLQRCSDAQFAFDEATNVEPGNAQAYLGLGSALNEQHEYAGAHKTLDRG